MKFFEPLENIVSFFNEKGIKYAIIGGIANSYYSEPRQTFDIDIKIILNIEKEFKKFIDEISKISKLLVKEPDDFVKKTMVVPIEISGVKIDILVASLPYEIYAINNSVLVDFEGFKINILKANDIIIHKAISEREKDWFDIKGIIKNKKNILDWDYILKNVKELSDWLGNSDFYNKLIEIKNEK
jgi:hypothetical protein